MAVTGELASANAGRSVYKDSATNFKYEPKKNKVIDNDWYGDEAAKHVDKMRARFPILQQLLTNGHNIGGRSTAQIDNAARQADAYNASYRYKANTGVPTVSANFSGAEGLGNGSYEAVTPLRTQDQAQMDTLRGIQNALASHQLSEEQYYNKQWFDAKMREMQGLTDQDYKQAFFSQNEEMRRLGALFDNFMDMNKAEFQAYMEKFNIPRDKAEEFHRLLRDGEFVKATLMWDAMGHNVMTTDQIAAELAGQKFVAELANNPNANIGTVFAQLGDVQGAALVGKVQGLVGRFASAPGDVGIVARNVISVAKDLSKTGANIAANSEQLMYIGGAIAAILGIGGTVAQFLKIPSDERLKRPV